MSGAAEQHDAIMRDSEAIAVLAEDGSSADLLGSRLLQLESMPQGHSREVSATA
jgi:hypothetical protein